MRRRAFAAGTTPLGLWLDELARIFDRVGVRWRSGGRRAGLPVLVVLVGLVWSTVLVAPAEAQTTSVTLRSAVAGLPVAAENRLGYDRDLFPHWVDEDRDGCHTRRHVLIAA